MNKFNIGKLKNSKDLDRVMDIWLNSNIEAHSFISGDYWLDNFAYVKRAIAKSDVRLICKDDEILGFIGIENGYIAGLFIDRNHRGLGLGSLLLEDAKSRYNSLSLHVYAKNIMAHKFYIKNGFKLISSKNEKELEYFMKN